MTGALFVYVTCPSKEIAQTIGRMAVEKQYAACANIISGMESIYRWQGKVETAAETVIVMKTTEGNWPALSQAIKDAHPYEVPSIVALPITHGHAPYLQWIAGETLPQA